MKIRQAKSKVELGSIVKIDQESELFMVDRFRTLHPGMEEVLRQAFCVPQKFKDALDGKWVAVNRLTVVGQIDTEVSSL